MMKTIKLRILAETSDFESLTSCNESTGSAAWSGAGFGSPAMPARRRKPQTMALFDAVQRRAGLLDFKQPLHPPRRGYSTDIVGAGRYLALR